MIDYLTALVEEEAVLELDGTARAVAERRNAEASGDVDSGAMTARELEVPWSVAGETFLGPAAVNRADGEEPWLEEAGRMAAGTRSLAEKLRRAGRVSRIASEGGGRSVAVTVPEMDGKPPALDLLELDRAVQRDARRYDGGFALF